MKKGEVKFEIGEVYNVLSMTDGLGVIGFARCEGVGNVKTAASARNRIARFYVCIKYDKKSGTCDEVFPSVILDVSPTGEAEYVDLATAHNGMVSIWSDNKMKFGKNAKKGGK